ncbi:hypothetical protein IWQ60_008615 [Tieghemiomyces parasiticus]|uniref:Uncharacterized protein n=1 Tax=Tieghemiomyces parasiticus TaxID=78921 RepID=A0A9W7ZVU7_9FUNG|nr:hypothetical protein IWQ60_008615 [Tieghemiomyces parasiticus]
MYPGDPNSLVPTDYLDIFYVNRVMGPIIMVFEARTAHEGYRHQFRQNVIRKLWALAYYHAATLLHHQMAPGALIDATELVDAIGQVEPDIPLLMRRTFATSYFSNSRFYRAIQLPSLRLRRWVLMGLDVDPDIPHSYPNADVAVWHGGDGTTQVNILCHQALVVLNQEIAKLQRRLDYEGHPVVRSIRVGKSVLGVAVEDHVNWGVSSNARSGGNERPSRSPALTYTEELELELELAALRRRRDSVYYVLGKDRYSWRTRLPLPLTGEPLDEFFEFIGADYIEEGVDASYLARSWIQANSAYQLHYRSLIFKVLADGPPFAPIAQFTAKQ